jgi:hypothetical protein
MPKNSRPSFPAPSEPSLRRLGVGDGGSSGDRPLKAQLVVALVAVLVLLAVPLYLWRRPSASSQADLDAGTGAAKQLPSVIEAGAQVIADRDAALAQERVKLGTPQRVGCGASPRDRSQEGSLCDSLPFFEQALAKAIRDTVDCAPRAKEEGTINFVLNVYFTNKSVHVFPGASGKWKGRQARQAAVCVEKALAPAPWASIQHQYRYYTLAILATYPPPEPIVGPPGAPAFE